MIKIERKNMTGEKYCILSSFIHLFFFFWSWKFIFFENNLYVIYMFVWRFGNISFLFYFSTLIVSKNIYEKILSKIIIIKHKYLNLVKGYIKNITMNKYFGVKWASAFNGKYWTKIENWLPFKNKSKKIFFTHSWLWHLT